MPARQASPSATLRRLNLSTAQYQTRQDIGAKRRRGESTEELEAQVQDGIERFVELDGQEIELRKRRQDLLWQIPNLPHANAPVGKDATDNPVVRSWGEKPDLKGAQDH